MEEAREKVEKLFRQVSGFCEKEVAVARQRLAAAEELADNFRTVLERPEVLEHAIEDVKAVREAEASHIFSSVGVLRDGTLLFTKYARRGFPLYYNGQTGELTRELHDDVKDIVARLRKQGFVLQPREDGGHVGDEELVSDGLSRPRS